MNTQIPHGSWCLFGVATGEPPKGKIVLVQHDYHVDADTGGRYSVRIYEPEANYEKFSSELRSSFSLLPDNSVDGYHEFTIAAEGVAELRIVGELVAVLG